MLLESLGLRERKGLDLIACPSCGRAEVDVIGIAAAAQAALEERNIPLQVAVMGCVVNGPGEAREADLGIAGGRGKGHLFVKGHVVRVVPEAEMVDALVDEAETHHGRGHRGPDRRRRRGRRRRGRRRPATSCCRSRAPTRTTPHDTRRAHPRDDLSDRAAPASAVVP